MALQAIIAVKRKVVVVEGSNLGFNIKVAKPPMFNKEVSKVVGFIITYRLCLRTRIREVLVEKQV